MRDQLKRLLGQGPYRRVPALSPAWRMVRRRYRQAAYRGHDVYCPVCRRAWRGWVNMQRWGLCPGCELAARHRWTWVYLNRSGLLPLPGSAIEFGPSRTLARLIRPGCVEYVTADASDPAADLTLDLTRTALPDAAFDLILCIHVLEHIPDDRAAISEMRRVLAPDGVALIQVPYNGDLPTDEDPSLGPDQRLQRFGQRDHVRRYGHDLADRLREAFPSVCIERPQDYLSPFQAERFGLWDIPMFVCRNRG